MTKSCGDVPSSSSALQMKEKIATPGTSSLLASTGKSGQPVRIRRYTILPCVDDACMRNTSEAGARLLSQEITQHPSFHQTPPSFITNGLANGIQLFSAVTSHGSMPVPLMAFQKGGEKTPKEMIWTDPSLTEQHHTEIGERIGRSGRPNTKNEGDEEDDESEVTRGDNTSPTRHPFSTNQSGLSSSSSGNPVSVRPRKWEASRRIYTVTKWGSETPQHHLGMSISADRMLARDGGIRFASIPIPEYKGLICLLVPLSSSSPSSEGSSTSPVKKEIIYATALSQPLHELKWHSAPRHLLRVSSSFPPFSTTNSANISTLEEYRTPHFLPSGASTRYSEGNMVSSSSLSNNNNTIVYDGQSLSQGWIAYRGTSVSGPLKKSDWKYLDAVEKEEAGESVGVPSSSFRRGRGKEDHEESLKESRGGHKMLDKSDIDRPVRVIPLKSRLPRPALLFPSPNGSPLSTAPNTYEGRKEEERKKSNQGGGIVKEDAAAIAAKKNKVDATSTHHLTGGKRERGEEEEQVQKEGTKKSGETRDSRKIPSPSTIPTPYSSSVSHSDATEEENIPATAAAVLEEWKSAQPLPGHHDGSIPPLSPLQEIGKRRKEGEEEKGEGGLSAERSIPVSQLEKMVLKALPTYRIQSEKFKNPQTKAEANRWFHCRRQELRSWLTENGFVIDPAGNVHL